MKVQQHGPQYSSQGNTELDGEGGGMFGHRFEQSVNDVSSSWLARTKKF